MPSLRQLARTAGVSAMAPYRHFVDKADLLRAVAQQGFDRLKADLEAVDRSSSGTEALVMQGLAYVRFAMRHPALFRLMFGDHCGEASQEDIGAGAFGVLARRVESITGSKAPTAPLACWAMVHGLAVLGLDGGRSPDESQVRAVLHFLASGLVSSGQKIPE